MTVCSATLAKDCAANLERALRSVESVVDEIVVVDTGSTDDTIETALGFGARVEKHEWVGFAHNRTELLRSAREYGDRILLLDSDMEFSGKLPGNDVDCWNATMHYGTISYKLPFLLNSRKEWRYTGAIHEYLECDGAFSQADTTAFEILHFGSSGARLESDKAVLEGAGAADTRNLFYLAQTYRDLGDVDAAIACYLARAELGGYDEERYWSLYQAGCLICAHRSFWDGAEVLLRAHKLRPGRAESLRALAYCAMNVADQIPYPKADRLFVEPGAYAPSGDADPVDLPDAPVGADAG